MLLKVLSILQHYEKYFVLLETNFFFQLHFRSGVQSDSKVTESAEDLVRELDELDSLVREQVAQLEAAIAQVDKYQLEVQQLRQQIVQVEQQLRAAMAPTYLPHDREQALADQQVGFIFVCFWINRINSRSVRWKWHELSCGLS